MTEGPYSDQCRNSARQGRSGEAAGRRAVRSTATPACRDSRNSLSGTLQGLRRTRGQDHRCPSGGLVPTMSKRQGPPHELEGRVPQPAAAGRGAGFTSGPRRTVKRYGPVE